ncbi:MAG: FMN-binding protein [Patescibacteria group bacterium]|nr:FMN-binding protein [Patescibacteria group bacterium]
MNKFLLSAGVVAAFALYAFIGQAHTDVSGIQTPIATNANSGTSNNPNASHTVSNAPVDIVYNKTPTKATTPIPAKSRYQKTPPAQTPASTPAPAPVAAAKFKDGTYTGPASDAYFGTVQVQAVVSGGKLSDVNILQYPSDRGTSREISASSLPTLKSEAIQSQSANVDAVSGATQTSQAFIQSLGSALAMAAN